MPLHNEIDAPKELCDFLLELARADLKTYRAFVDSFPKQAEQERRDRTGAAKIARQKRKVGILAALENGERTLTSVAKEFGVSIENVRQIRDRDKRESFWKRDLRGKISTFNEPLDTHVHLLVADNVRAANMIRNEKEDMTCREYLAMSEAELRRIPNFGRKSLRALDMAVEAHTGITIERGRKS